LLTNYNVKQLLSEELMHGRRSTNDLSWNTCRNSACVGGRDSGPSYKTHAF